MVNESQYKALERVFKAYIEYYFKEQLIKIEQKKDIMEIIKNNNKLQMKNTTTNRISRTRAVELINNSKGRRFTITFKKQNGELRTMKLKINKSTYIVR